MTRTYTRPMLSALFLLPLLLLTACDSGLSALPEAEPMARGRGDFTIASKAVAVSETHFEGTFKASGMLDDQGRVREEFDSAAPLHQRPSVHGLKRLESEKGTLLIEFYAGLSATKHNTVIAKGGFTIAEGTGVYRGLKGGGEINAELPLYATAAALTNVLVGEAWYAE